MAVSCKKCCPEMSVSCYCKCVCGAHTELLHLSDSYCEKQLKRACEKILWQSVSVENAAGLITVADKYKAEVYAIIAKTFQGIKSMFVI